MEGEKVQEKDGYGLTEAEERSLEASQPRDDMPAEVVELESELGVEGEGPEEDLEEVSAYFGPNAIMHGKTKEHKLPNGKVIRSMSYTYKPMTDLERIRYMEKVSQAGGKKISEIDLEKMRRITYRALSKHILSIEGMQRPDGPFDCTSTIHWGFVYPEIIEELLDAVRGNVEISERDLKNLLAG